MDWAGVLSREFYNEYQDRKVVIAGGASGMGAALTSAFHWLGARTVILDKNTEHANALADRLGHDDNGQIPLHRPIVLCGDLSIEPERKQVVSQLIEDGIPPSYFISTIGYDKRIDLKTHTQDDLETLLRINFIAPIMLASDLVDSIRQAGGGSICLFTSHHGDDLFDTNMMGYGAAKAALNNGIMRLAKFAAERNSKDNMIRVFGLCPGWVQTENQTSRFQAEEFDRELRNQLIPVAMKAEDIAPFVISCLSQRNAALLSGTILNYDAGAGQIHRTT